MQKVCFLSTDNLEDFFVWDDLLLPHFATHGYTVDVVSWHAKNVDWSQYEMVIVRSTWDYQDDADTFVQVLKQIDQADTILANPLGTMQWNISKRYLQELQNKGIDIIPSKFYQTMQSRDLIEHFAIFGCDEIVIKPLVSANSDNTFRLTLESLQAQHQLIDLTFKAKECVVQPFLNSIINDGEYSLFYFNGQYSHAIKKVPKSGDFRVQEEHGGQLFSVTPDMHQKAAGEKVLSVLPTETLYARVDLAYHQGLWQLMEVELIEPSLYFNMDEGSAARFVAATLDYLNK